MMSLLAQAVVETSKDEIQQGYGGLIFMGLFLLTLLAIGIWWLKRQA